jgi:hypothetical protein
VIDSRVILLREKVSVVVLSGGSVVDLKPRKNLLLARAVQTTRSALSTRITATFAKAAASS